jgi:hypothetical protein
MWSGSTIFVVRLAPWPGQRGAAVDVPADDEDTLLRLQQGAAQCEEIVGAVDQHSGPPAIGEAPAGVVFLKNSRSFGGHGPGVVGHASCVVAEGFDRLSSATQQ